MTGYCVNWWGSKPHSNDDCHSGRWFDLLADAETAYNGSHPSFVAWIELDGPEIHKERQNPDYKPDTTLDDVWENEWEHQQRMLGGCDVT